MNDVRFRLASPGLFLCLLLAVLAVPGLAATLNIRDFGAKCDGKTNDTAAIQAAINAAQRGDIVLFPGPGLAGVASPGVLVQGKTDVTLKGENGGGIILLSDTEQKITAFSKVMLVLQGCTRCTVTDLVMEGNKQNASALGFDQCVACTAQRVTIRNVGRWTGNGNDCPSAALVAAGNRNNIYRDNVIDTTAHFPNDDGIRGMWIGNWWDMALERYPTITGNLVKNTGFTGMGNHCIGGWIANNEVTGVKAGAGIKAVPPPKSITLEKTIIERNNIHDLRGQGIQLDEGHDVIVRFNTITATTNAGVYCNPSVPEDLVITRNTITNIGPIFEMGAIFMHGGRNIEISYNTIRDTRQGNARTLYSGIGLHGGYENYANYRIFGNTIENCIRNGVTLYEGQAAFENFDINANTFAKNSQYGVGVLSAKATRINVYQNTFTDNGKGAIYGTQEGKAALETPKPLDPANQATGVSNFPQLSWTPVPGATAYIVEISPDLSFTSGVDSQTVPTPNAGFHYLSNDMMFYWRVRAVRDTAMGPWSEIRRFTVASIARNKTIASNGEE